MKLTNEQKSIINSTGNIKINAVAGSGKTTTLIEYARKQPKKSRILYLAFNRSVRLEAINKFKSFNLDNVDIHTPHSLAYKNIVFQNGYNVIAGYKRHEIINILKINWKGSTGYLLAGHISSYADLFCSSTCSKVADVNYLETVSNQTAAEFVKAFEQEILQGTRKFLALMEYGKIDITHSFYLKKFQLSQPRLPYNLILFDEGQDASPVMLDIFLKQNSKKVIVGDIHQQIYGWRNAVNALQNVDFKEFQLSKSFRFDSGIADLALKTLDLKKYINTYSENKILGMGKRKKKIKSRAFIARTNLSLFAKAIDLIFEQGAIKNLYFEGNLNSYTYANDGASLFDVLNLYNDKKDYIRDPIVKNMDSFSDLCKYAEEQNDQDLNMLIELVRKYGDKIPWYIKKIREIHLEDENREKADIIFSTVHRCKGLEYDQVTLADDFISEDKILKIIEDNKTDNDVIKKVNEEINLLYVAITRSCSELNLNNIFKKELPSRFMIKDFPVPIDGTRYQKGRKDKVKAGAFWKSEDEIILEKMLYRGKSVSQISLKLGRSIGAIQSRIRKLGLDELFFD